MHSFSAVPTLITGHEAGGPPQEPPIARLARQPVTVLSHNPRKRTRRARNLSSLPRLGEACPFSREQLPKDSALRATLSRRSCCAPVRRNGRRC